MVLGYDRYTMHPRFHSIAMIMKNKMALVTVYYPPLGVEVIWEFQEFQELKTTQSNFKRRKRVAKIKRRKMFDRRAFILFRT